jgi:hypothetical protein
MTKMSSTDIINPKPCNYNCGTRIYWKTSENAYLEVFTKTRHICKNRITNNNNVSKSSTYIPKSNYYNKFRKQPKPKMSNSFELLTGSVSEIQKKYEILSDIVTEYNGKVHGSQRDRDPKTGLIDLLVYLRFQKVNARKLNKFNDFIIYNIENSRIHSN